MPNFITRRNAPLRGIANIRTGLSQNLSRLVNKIVEGDLSFVSSEKYCKAWFTTPIDNYNNKLVAFAAKIALQRGFLNLAQSTKNKPVFTPWGSIFRHLVVKTRELGVPVFTQAAGKKDYTIAHVIADHAEKERDVEEMLKILVTDSGRNLAGISKEMKKRQGSIYSPGAIANRRGVLSNGTHTGAFAPLFRRLKIPNKVNSHEYMGIMRNFEKLTLEKEEEKKKRVNAERRAIKAETALMEAARRYKYHQSKAQKTTARAGPSQAGPSGAGLTAFMKRTMNNRNKMNE